MENVMTIMGRDPQLSRGQVGSLGLVLATMFRDRHPENTSGHMARALGCTKKTAENILAGHLSARTVTMIIAAFGPGFVAEAVMAAAGTNLEQFIENEAAEAERAAAKAREHAEEARRRYANFKAARRSGAGDDRAHP